MQTTMQKTFVGSTASLRGARAPNTTATRGMVLVRAQQQQDNVRVGV